MILNVTLSETIEYPYLESRQRNISNNCVIIFVPNQQFINDGLK